MSDEAARARLMREARLASKLNDPHICTIYDVGEDAQAPALLERAYAERDPNMPFIGCNPIFDPLRAEPRFQALLRKVNLPQ